jgi:uncharacterized protein (TIGR03067 family)
VRAEDRSGVAHKLGGAKCYGAHRSISIQCPAAHRAFSQPPGSSQHIVLNKEHGMRATRLLGGMILLVFLGTAGAEDKADAKLDAAKIVGSWSYVSAVRDGAKVDADRLKDGTVKITKETITLENDMGKFVIKYKLDTKKSPAQLEMEITEGPQGVGAKAAGIIELKGEELKLAYIPMGEEAPKDFAAKEGSKAHSFVLKKKK